MILRGSQPSSVVVNVSVVRFAITVASCSIVRWRVAIEGIVLVEVRRWRWRQT